MNYRILADLKSLEKTKYVVALDILEKKVCSFPRSFCSITSIKIVTVLKLGLCLAHIYLLVCTLESS